ncbi:MAG TPA: alanine racemase [Acidimicrobiales bacterium]|nr:alanine racemase [Acidimicrobiales bacterium]
MNPARLRPAWAEVDLDAIAGNASLLARLVRPARLCAVVKANAYGHGSVAAARAALAGGASWLAVALTEEGEELRQAGVDAPVLILSEPFGAAMEEAVLLGLTPTVYTLDGVAAAAAARRPGRPPVSVHVKVDTGMHRVGADLDDAVAVAEKVGASPDLRLEGLWTHMAVADADPAYTAEQLERFERVRAALAERGVVPEMVHAANSAGAILRPASRYDLVRTGIALYGYPPAPEHGARPELVGLRPALQLKARVTHVRRLAAGERISYGRRYSLPEESVVATVPLGYADGVPRRLYETGGTVLVGGRRRPIAGVVTMDQLMVDCGPGADVSVGDEVVLIGRQGDEAVTAEDWAGLLGTISYEVVSALSARVARRYTGGPTGAGSGAD